ncbi:MAG: type ISP restriction/modification enzyme [Allosphingosinicella sp.]
MSRRLINEYRAELDRLRAVTGSTRETNLRPAFARLLRAWGKQDLDLVFVEEHQIRTARGNLISVDGALLHALRVPFGYWEAKDERDDLDAEITAKFRKGYPRDNIIFSDDRIAVLWQDNAEITRVAMDDTEALYTLLIRFFAHERQEIADFNKAVKQFATDLPAILEALRDRIAEKHAASRDFANAVADFLKHARDAINPAVSEDDVREMLIQHVLTEDIFAKVFDNPDFHQHNNIAAELKKVEDALFGRGEKAQLLRALAPYYSGIASAAALISSHSEKQGFLKALYEDFYKAYNRKAADRLGVVYTPGEIVRFMIRSADWLCEKHFGKNLVDPGVEILDPATGTGTFIVELLEHFRGNHEKLRYKYKEELHANEVAILPYYVANLNIEATYQAITGQFGEYENLCLVDTLDNVDALGIHSGHQFDLLGSLSDENIERIKRQNRRKISVIIGNPPYNANQQNENDNNKNRAYAHIDKRIKNTYIKASTAQKTKLYDMYARFFRWASDRLGEDGVLAFITNRSFLDSRTFDGFRRTVAEDFSRALIVDLGGDYKKFGVAGGGNVFDIGTGVAISFWLRCRNQRSFHLGYLAAPAGTSGDEKRSWLEDLDLSRANFTELSPASDATWLEQPGEDAFAGFLPIASKEAKAQVDSKRARAIFHLFLSGIKTNRGEWVYDRGDHALVSKADYFAEVFDAHPRIKGLPAAPFDPRIKWSRDLKQKRGFLRSNRRIAYVEHRPFSRISFLNSHLLADVYTTLHNRVYGDDLTEPVPTIPFLGRYSSNPLAVLATDRAFDYDFLKMGNGGTESVPRFHFSRSGDRVDNITDWALNKFVAQYGKRTGVTKDAIFHYVYAILHDPVYREKYALNLKREFPRIPLYPDFAKWAAWGEALMAMHIGYENVDPWPVERVETPGIRAAGTHPKPILRSEPEKGGIIIDADTQIIGVPSQAWRYRLGNRSALDWVLDQHKEKKPRDPTIAAKFNTYRFADYKESMIALLAKVVRVSVDTVAITDAMKALDRASWESE